MKDPNTGDGVLDIGQPVSEQKVEETQVPARAESFRERAKRIGEERGIYSKDGKLAEPLQILHLGGACPGDRA